MHCYEYFNCQKDGCPMFADEGQNCWERHDLSCNNPCHDIMHKLSVEELIETRQMICQACLYYKYKNNLFDFMVAVR